MNLHFASVGDDVEKEKETCGCQVHFFFPRESREQSNARHSRETTDEGVCFSVDDTW